MRRCLRGAARLAFEALPLGCGWDGGSAPGFGAAGRGVCFRLEGGVELEATECVVEYAGVDERGAGA